MPDKQIKCIECGNEFVYTQALQDKLATLYEEGKIDSVTEPKRCQPCRAERKQRSRSQGA
jgi:hypothetical protein